MDNIEQLRKVATRAGKLLTSLSESIRQQKEELKLTEFYQEYSKAALYKLPKLSKGSVEYAVSEMEAGGYIFKKKPSGNTMKYAMTIQNVIDLYNHRKVPKYRDRFDKAFTIFVCNLKGGGFYRFIITCFSSSSSASVRRPAYSGHRFRSAGISDNVPEP